MKKNYILSFLLIFVFLLNIRIVYAIPSDAIAEIDGSYYKSLALAIKTLDDNTKTTIVLLKDRNENVTIPVDKEVVLDLNGFTLGNNGENATVITNNGKLEIINGTVTSDAKSGMINNNSKGILVINDGSYIATGSRQVIYNNGGNVTISGTAYLSSATTERATIHNLGNGTVNISGGTIIAENSYAVYNDKGTLNIGVLDDEYNKTSPVIQGKTYGVIANNKINVYDGIIKGGIYHLGKANSSSTPTVTDDINESKIENIEDFSEKKLDEEEIGEVVYNTLTYNLDSASIIKITFDPVGGDLSKNTKKIIIGNTIGTLPEPIKIDNLFDGWFTEEIGGTLITEETEPTSNITYYAHWTYVDPNTVAYVEGSGLMSLEDAVAIGGNIRIEKDVVIPSSLVINKDAVLDLNGHTIYLKNNSITINSEITITDNTSDKFGKITSTSLFTVSVGEEGYLIFEGGTIEGLGTYGAIKNNGLLEINGGTAYSSVDTSNPDASEFTVYNRKTFIMNSGTVHSTKGRAMQIYDNSIFEMNGGLVKTDSENDQAIQLRGNCSAIINDGVIEAMSDNSAGIAMFKNTELTVNGGTITGTGMGISGNGNENSQNANITINDGTIVGLNGVGMYLPQMNSTTIINGGIISGPTGIEIRAGKLIVNDGFITGTSDEYVVNTNDSGTTTKGAAIAVTQHNTKQPIEVIINGGNLKSPVPIVESNPQNNPEEYIEQVTIYVNEGNFEATGDKVIDAENPSTIIQQVTGGVYTYDPSEFVNDDYGVIEKEDNTYEVTRFYKVTIVSDIPDAVMMDNTKYPQQAVVSVNPTDKEGLEPIIEIKGESGTPIELKGYKFVMPQENVIINVTYRDLINPNTVDNLIIYFKILVVSFTGLGSVVLYKKKTNN